MALIGVIATGMPRLTSRPDTACALEAVGTCQVANAMRPASGQASVELRGALTVFAKVRVDPSYRPVAGCGREHGT
jgi:hypothetical protein